MMIDKIFVKLSVRQLKASAKQPLFRRFVEETIKKTNDYNNSGYNSN